MITDLQKIPKGFNTFIKEERLYKGLEDTPLP